jgi:hypothetical protein
MNLLLDQRETQASEQTPMPREFEYEPAPLTEEPVFEETPPSTSPMTDFYEYERPQKSKSYFFPVLLIVVLISAIAGATYFGFFYKPGDLDFLTTLWQKKQPTPSIVAPPTTVVLADTTRSEPAVEPVTSRPESSAVIVQPPATASATMTANDAISQMMNAVDKIVTLIPPSVSLSTLVMDESSFSLEVSSDSRDAMERFYADLKLQMPCELVFAPTTGKYQGVRSLMTGSLSARSADGAAVSDLSATDLCNELRKMAKTAGLAILEITPLKHVGKTPDRRTPIFIKTRGAMTEFASFNRLLVEKNWNLQPAKLILMTTKSKAMTFVLRLELARPA